MRIAVLVGVFVFHGLALFFFVYAIRGFLGGPNYGSVVFGVLGGGILYVARAGFKLIPYLRCTIEVDESGFRIIREHEVESFSWAQPLYFSNSSTLEILEVFDANGNTVLAIDHKIPNFDVILSSLESASDI